MSFYLSFYFFYLYLSLYVTCIVSIACRNKTLDVVSNSRSRSAHPLLLITWSSFNEYVDKFRKGELIRGYSGRDGEARMSLFLPHALKCKGLVVYNSGSPYRLNPLTPVGVVHLFSLGSFTHQKLSYRYWKALLDIQWYLFHASLVFKIGV